jgi:hypothetical protein
LRKILIDENLSPSLAESHATALRVRKAEIMFWIEEGGLQATVASRNKCRS